MIKEELRKLQEAELRERKERHDAAIKEMNEYLESEQAQRDAWEKREDYFEKKAKREGWHYTRLPFISAYDRQKMEEQKKAEKKAELRAKLEELEDS